MKNSAPFVCGFTGDEVVDETPVFVVLTGPSNHPQMVVPTSMRFVESLVAPPDQYPFPAKPPGEHGFCVSHAITIVSGKKHRHHRWDPHQPEIGEGIMYLPTASFPSRLRDPRRDGIFSCSQSR